MITGSSPALGDWSPHEGLELSGDDWVIWRGEVELLLGARAHYKVVVLGRDGSVTWERGVNRQLRLSADEDAQVLQLSPQF